MGSFKEIIKGDVPVLVDFHATWCGPCKMMSPIIDAVKKEFGEQLRVLKVDVDKNNAASAKYKVRGVPTLLLFKNGEIVWRESGVKSQNELRNVINGVIK